MSNELEIDGEGCLFETDEHIAGCPFCRKIDVKVRTPHLYYYDYGYRVGCPSCFTLGPLMGKPEEAVASWNDHSPSDIAGYYLLIDNMIHLHTEYPRCIEPLNSHQISSIVGAVMRTSQGRYNPKEVQKDVKAVYLALVQCA